MKSKGFYIGFVTVVLLFGLFLTSTAYAATLMDNKPPKDDPFYHGNEELLELTKAPSLLSIESAHLCDDAEGIINKRISWNFVRNFLAQCHFVTQTYDYKLSHRSLTESTPHLESNLAGSSIIIACRRLLI